MGFRIAAARQELEVDRRPTLATTKKFAEFLQAEAEDLALTMPQPSSTKTTSPAAGTQPVGGAQPTIKALAGGYGSGDGQQKPKQACRYWGTSAGRKRGESCACTFAHSWEGINKTDRCFHCSGENHFAKDCPYGRDRPGKDGKKTAKLKGGGKPQAEKTEEASKPGTSSTTPTTPTSPASPSKEDEKKEGGSVGGGKSEDPAKELIAEATSLLKTLRAMKRVKLKQVSVDLRFAGRWRDTRLASSSPT